MNDSEGFIAGAFLIIGLIGGLIIGCNSLDAHWEADAIEQGYAEYHKTTGEWQWVELEEEL